MEYDMNADEAKEGRWVKKDNVSAMESQGWTNTKHTAKRSMGSLVLMTKTEKKAPEKKSAKGKK